MDADVAGRGITECIYVCVCGGCECVCACMFTPLFDLLGFFFGENEISARLTENVAARC